jgi:glycosyltransferase involved in cell wall biosynthesis
MVFSSLKPHMKKITFLIPVYNEEKTVGKAIEIVLSLKKIKNKEIIIIDNGSKDRSQEIIKKYKKKKLKIILRRKNLGIGATIKQAIEISTGKYLYIHFSDNEYDISPIFEMIKLAEKYNLDAVFGSRLKKYSFLKKILLLKFKPSYLGTLIITTLYNVLYNKNFSDVIGSEFYKLSSIKKIYKSDSNYFKYNFILKNRLMSGNFKIEEVFTNYKPRFTKYGNVKCYHIFPAVYEILKFKLLHSIFKVN